MLIINYTLLIISLILFVNNHCFQFINNTKVESLITINTTITLIDNDDGDKLCQNCTQLYVNNYICYKNQTNIINNDTIIQINESINCICEPGYELIIIDDNKSSCLFIEYPVYTVHDETPNLNSKCLSSFDLNIYNEYCMLNDGIPCIKNTSNNQRDDQCLCLNNSYGDYCEIRSYLINNLNSTNNETSIKKCNNWAYDNEACNHLRVELIALIVVISVIIVLLITIGLILCYRRSKNQTKASNKELNTQMRFFYTDFTFKKQIRILYLPSETSN